MDLLHQVVGEVLLGRGEGLPLGEEAVAGEVVHREREEGEGARLQEGEEGEGACRAGREGVGHHQRSGRAAALGNRSRLRR